MPGLTERLRTCATALFCAWALAGCGGSPSGPTLTLSGPDIKTLDIGWPDDALATGYRLLVETAATPERTEVARLPAHTTRHRLHVFLPDQRDARYTVQACSDAGCRDLAAGVVSAATLNEAVGRFAPGAGGNGAGRGVALSADGNTLAVGAPLDDSEATDSGAVFLFTREPAGWVRQAVLKSAAPAPGERFGEAVALSSDGLRLVVGAPGHAAGRGAIHVFDRTAGQWAPQWTQTDPFPWTVLDAPREFGRVVALSGDGRTLMAGRLDGDYVATVFGFDQGSWTGEASVPGNGIPEDISGTLSGNGDTLLIGRPQAITPAGTTGQVSVYQRVQGAWQDLATLMASNAGVLTIIQN